MPICPTWRTPVCLPCQVSSTSSWLWWSPKATLTRNLSTTMVNHQQKMRIWDGKSDAFRQLSAFNNKTLFSQIITIFFVFLVIFLSLVFVLTALMTWLVLYPGPVVGKALKLYDFSDMEFKLLLVALAALNLILCFVAEVSNDMKTWACRLWTVITP